jgi:hypothetical protein
MRATEHHRAKRQDDRREGEGRDLRPHPRHPAGQESETQSHEERGESKQERERDHGTNL